MSGSRNGKPVKRRKPKDARTKRPAGRRGKNQGSAGKFVAVTYDDLLTQLESLPEDPLEIPGYMARLLGQAALRTLKGQGNYQLNSDLRAFARDINRLIPIERIRRAERTILEARAQKKPSERRGARVESVKPEASNSRPTRR